MHTTATLAADALTYDRFPDYVEFDTAAWAVQDTLDRLADE